MKIINLLLIALFVYAAAVQYNDPDPYLWMPMYLYGAVISFLAIKGKYNFAMYVIGIATYLGFAIYHFSGETGMLAWLTTYQAESLTETMQATKPWIEETREFFGLTLLTVSLTANMIWMARIRKTQSEPVWKIIR